MGKFIHHSECDMVSPIPKTLEEAFQNLPTSLQQVCGSVHFPPDDGRDIINNIPTNQCIFGASDASFRKDCGSHTWIISTGNRHDIQNERLHISDSGPIIGFTPNISASQGELQGMEPNIDLFLTQSDISKCIPTHTHWVRSHSDKQKWESIEDLEHNSYPKMRYTMCGVTDRPPMFFCWELPPQTLRMSLQWNAGLFSQYSPPSIKSSTI
jgi:hypothetical protein